MWQKVGAIFQHRLWLGKAFTLRVDNQPNSGAFSRRW
jgi:hypothetical protein